ncbi:MAG: hypothetical protein EPO63_00415 [Candidatus Nitrosotenuis sp.]|nr:MAG: hypothetical protein EPO63_00415 [Candidatus Nitrosotenuis sp.]
MIDDTIILQVDATVIAGLLILLSITSVWSKNQNEILTTKITKSKGIYWSPRQIFFIVIPFSISAMATLGHFIEPTFMRYLSVSMCAVGFFFIMIIGFLISTKDRVLKTPKQIEDESMFSKKEPEEKE